MKVAVIPARGGSQRIPGKNIRPFHGKPIIAYSIEAAKKSGLFDSILVSTDSAEIATISELHGAEVFFRRYDDGSRGTQEVTADVLRSLERVWQACCIYATAPLLTAADLRCSFEMFVTNPYRYVYVNGWYYWGNAEDFSERPELEQSLELDRVVGDRWIDINTEDDWRRAEEMYAALKR